MCCLKVLKQLQTIQQSMQSNVTTSTSQHEMEEKKRKLQQMNFSKQEEEFDKHLAQTVPVSHLFNIPNFSWHATYTIYIKFLFLVSDSSICIGMRIKTFWYFETKYTKLCTKCEQ